MNTEGKGNLFEAFATVLMTKKDLDTFRQLLFQILATDELTEKPFKVAMALIRNPVPATARVAVTPYPPSRARTGLTISTLTRALPRLTRATK